MFYIFVSFVVWVFAYLLRKRLPTTVYRHIYLHIISFFQIPVRFDNFWQPINGNETDQTIVIWYRQISNEATITVGLSTLFYDGIPCLFCFLCFCIYFAVSTYFTKTTLKQNMRDMVRSRMYGMFSRLAQPGPLHGWNAYKYVNLNLIEHTVRLVYNDTDFKWIREHVLTNSTISKLCVILKVTCY